jgi:hypothetical protein
MAKLLYTMLASLAARQDIFIHRADAAPYV